MSPRDSEHPELDKLMSDRTALVGYVTRRCSDASQVDDVIQETHLRLIEQTRKRSIENLMAYAYRVADSVLYRMRRKRPDSLPAQLCEDTLQCELPLVDEQVVHRERLRQLSGRLEGMSPMRRQVFIKRHLDGLPRAVIAQQLGISVEAVKKHLVRAMADLARHMDEADNTIRKGDADGPAN